MKKKANHLGLEHFLQKNELRPDRKCQYKGITVFLAEGGPYGPDTRMDKYPMGWYESCYWLGLGEKVLGGRVLEFDRLHDISTHTDESRKLGRLNSAKEAAFQHVDNWLKSLAEDGIKWPN